MSDPPTTFDAGQPRISGPIRRVARPLGPLARPVAGKRWFPLYAVLHHIGRTSGKSYATPVVGLRTTDGFLIPLPFGAATQWARNLFAAGGGRFSWAGREYRITEPRVVDLDVAGSEAPRIVRFLSRWMGLRQFVLVRSVEA